MIMSQQAYFLRTLFFQAGLISPRGANSRRHDNNAGGKGGLFRGSRRQENSVGTKEGCWQAHGGKRTTQGRKEDCFVAHGSRRTTRDKGGLLAGSRRQENRGWLEFPTDHARKLNAKRRNVCEIMRSVKRNVSSNKERNLKNRSV